jgi:hypothetical protein
VDAIYVVAGAVVVALTAIDVVATLVTTRRLKRRSPTQVFYRYTWSWWAALGRRIGDDDRRESFLSVYGPVSLLGLLFVWVVLFMIGWGLVWLGLRDHVHGVHDYLDAIYFAGTTFFTVGFGDIVAYGPLARILTLVEALAGVLTTALVIGYLPTIYGAYSRRESQLLLLDDLDEDAVTPAGFVASFTRHGNLDELHRSFHDWERWCADVFDTHTAYPMLLLFRSRQVGRSWLSGLTIVLEAAVYTMGVLDQPSPREAELLYRRAVVIFATFVQSPERAEAVIDSVVGTAAVHPLVLAGKPVFRHAYDRLVAAGLPCRPYEQAWANVQALRALYVPHLDVLAKVFVVPPTFRTHAPKIPTIPAMVDPNP